MTQRGAAPLILLLCLPLLAAAQADGPQIFAPGMISSAANDGTPAFTPDGRTLFFTRSGPQWGFILESRAQGEGWSQPRLASFSGEFPDSSPSMAPDGSYLLFESLRPADGASAGKTPRRCGRLSAAAAAGAPRSACRARSTSGPTCGGRRSRPTGTCTSTSAPRA